MNSLPMAFYNCNILRRFRNIAVDSAQIGDAIREARERMGMTQEELAEKVGRDQRAISEYEHGKRRLSAADLPLYARALNVSLLYFYGELVADEDFEAALLQHFNRLSTPEAKNAAIELVRVFTEAMESR
jgi:transcriptional regulator with XRE-family HTH domain